VKTKLTYRIRIFLIVSMALAVFSCTNYQRGNGNIVELHRNLEDFSSIKIHGNYEVVLIPSKDNILLIETDENLHRYVESDVNHLTLTIRNSGRIISRQSIKVLIHFKQIEHISSSGNSVISCTNIIKTQDLAINLTGTGSINLELEAERLKVDLPGAGLVKLVGYVTQQEIKINGTGNLNAINLVSNETKIEVNGVGKAEINVRETLDAELNGIGTIKYVGEPKELKQEVRGLGSIKEINKI
jgi:hypothetical protein